MYYLFSILSMSIHTPYPTYPHLSNTPSHMHSPLPPIPSIAAYYQPTPTLLPSILWCWVRMGTIKHIFISHALTRSGLASLERSTSLEVRPSASPPPRPEARGGKTDPGSRTHHPLDTQNKQHCISNLETYSATSTTGRQMLATERF